eukprot:1146914-Pelagomonas_calceolata.AAC.14
MPDRPCGMPGRHEKKERWMMDEEGKGDVWQAIWRAFGQTGEREKKTRDKEDREMSNWPYGLNVD